MATALITGASSGIGLELARVFAGDGIDVILAARSEDKLNALAQELKDTHGVSAEVAVIDLSVQGAAKELYDRIVAKGWTVDTLVNNAGFGTFGHFVETDWAIEAAMLNVNIVALTQLTKLFVPTFVAQGHGRILNVASTAAFQAGPLMAVYFATKAYVLSFSEGLAAEMKGTRVTVTAQCPGPTETGFLAAADVGGSRLFERRLPTGADVARFGYRAMNKGRRVVVHGLMNKVLVQANRIAPRKLAAAITKGLLSKG
jgi:short-subunit dehydrogenase